MYIRTLFTDFYEHGIPERVEEYLADPQQFQKKARDYVRFYCLGEWEQSLFYVAPPEFRMRVKMLLLVHNRLTNPLLTDPCLPALPPEILGMIMPFLHT